MNFGTGLSQIGWQEAELRAFFGLPGWRSRPVARLGLFLASPGWDGDPVARLGSPGVPVVLPGLVSKIRSENR